MADSKFADAALARFNGGDTEGPAEEAAPGEEVDSDSTMGKMLAAALKKGDGEAICTAVRKICGQ